MNKINVLLIILSFITQVSISQNDKVFVVDDKNDYAFLLDSDMKQQTKTIFNTEIDIYAKSDSLQFHYTLLVSKIINNGFKKGNLMNEEYDSFYRNSCTCEILDTDIVIYNNLKAIRHFMIKKRDQNTFKGINLSFVSGKYLYNILFLAEDKNFEKEKENLPDIMNTMVINGKTTIDEYSEYKTENIED